jgi:hypothetical protein
MFHDIIPPFKRGIILSSHVKNRGNNPTPRKNDTLTLFTCNKTDPLNHNPKARSYQKITPQHVVQNTTVEARQKRTVKH